MVYFAKRSAFTLVELLVVIVIIAILSSLATLAYSGMQKRAEMTKYVSNVKAYVEAVKLYEVDHEWSEADNSGAIVRCLGGPYTQSAHLLADYCIPTGDGVEPYSSEVDAKLRAIAPNLPNFSSAEFYSEQDNFAWRGVERHEDTIRYRLLGYQDTTDCPIGEKVVSNDPPANITTCYVNIR